MDCILSGQWEGELMQDDDTGPQEEQADDRPLPAGRRSVRPSRLLPVVVLCLAGASALLLRRIRVTGFSMAPTLRPGQRLLVQRLASRLGRSPRRFELVLLRHPDGSGRLVTKRVIALPGETVAVRRGQVLLNGQRLLEPYVRHPANYRWGPITVPPQHTIVLGDNRAGSKDSHLWGAVPDSLLVGTVLLRYWPPGRIRSPHGK